MNPVRAILIDDHELLLRGLSLIFQTLDEVDIVATSTDGSTALALANEHRADVVITDAAMPGTDGLAVVNACTPHVPVLVLTTFDDHALVSSLVSAGASGYILKDVAPEELARAVVAAAHGGLALDPRVARHAYQPSTSTLAVLTRTERAVAEHVAVGRTNSEIAAALYLAEGTVKNHVSALLRKLSCRNRTALALRLSKALGK
ncbi:response regulator [Corynebacterium doosanense]|uniref:Transcriptional regulator n=1 Tax=Corynebacterium doosanense CAU 212 = DSM 45436 TaxID=558173 RepID=A0A097IEJ4_9CORY|nr:response regulator transcription factor [Corynebacterium doosanense]AIT60553.1 transcriptional regulator [Corynebacterium doosanense CAU 212 = DSM 45436]